jgi:hypothetical protein
MEGQRIVREEGGRTRGGEYEESEVEVNKLSEDCGPKQKNWVTQRESCVFPSRFCNLV